MKKEERKTEFTPRQVERLRQALTAGAEELFEVVRDPSEEVLHAAMKNPAFGEDHLLVLLRRRDLSKRMFKTLCSLASGEPSRKVKLALARNPKIPGPLLRSLLPHLFLFELLDICTLPAATVDQKAAAERGVIQRLPAAPLGEKMTLARRGTAALAEAILLEGNEHLLEGCLGNPRLKEASIHRFLASAKAGAETISGIARHPKWKRRPELKLAILKNPKTPAIWFTLLLPEVKSAEIRALLSSSRLNPAQKELLNEELERRRRISVELKKTEDLPLD